ELKNVHQNMVISPVPKLDPTIESKLKTITIKIKDTLQPNTTYSLNFGNAIQDINEGNILKNFTYVFSTGPYLDSMQYSGKVVLASTGKPDSTLIVMLHRKFDDSAVYKDRPRYITKVDSGGNFKFRYIEPGTYAVYALKDESGLKKYTSKAQIFAFADSPIVVKENPVPITLYAFQDTTKQKPTKKTVKKAPPPTKKEEKEKRLVVGVNLASGQLDLLDTFKITFQTPIKYFDSTKVRLTDQNYNDLAGYHFVEDTTRKKVTMYYKWKPDTRYILIVSKDFAEDTSGFKLLKIDTLNFQTKKESDYAVLRLRFRNLDRYKNPILEFVQGDEIKRTYVFGNSRSFYDKLFRPGDYELRILEDRNKNGVWDPGDFFGKHLQPEIVRPVRQKMTLKGNWENEFDITL
ncbi:MAG TPA: Ig-like domain-containing domain, partial [Puia sp.]|nr:Ig-like domain-containing domain [Puia sp.]